MPFLNVLCIWKLNADALRALDVNAMESVEDIRSTHNERRPQLMDLDDLCLLLILRNLCPLPDLFHVAQTNKVGNSPRVLTFTILERHLESAEFSLRIILSILHPRPAF